MFCIISIQDEELVRTYGRYEPWGVNWYIRYSNLPYTMSVLYCRCRWVEIPTSGSRGLEHSLLCFPALPRPTVTDIVPTQRLPNGCMHAPTCCASRKTRAALINATAAILYLYGRPTPFFRLGVTVRLRAAHTINRWPGPRRRTVSSMCTLSSATTTRTLKAWRGTRCTARSWRQRRSPRFSDAV